MKICITLLCMLLLAGCWGEYGDVQGTASSFDVIMGLKVRPSEIVALRSGSFQFTGCFIFEFPMKTKTFFESPPPELFEHPKPMRYDKGKTLIKWRRTLFEAEHHHFFEQSLELAQLIGLENEYVVALTNLVATTNGFYALSYKDDGAKRSHSVELLIIDPKTRRFYELTDTSFPFKPNDAPEMIRKPAAGWQAQWQNSDKKRNAKLSGEIGEGIQIRHPDFLHLGTYAGMFVTHY